MKQKKVSKQTIRMKQKCTVTKNKIKKKEEAIINKSKQQKPTQIKTKETNIKHISRNSKNTQKK